ncbi:hypothetical protein ACFQX4_23225 [Roseomonas sp. GCM10028921]
MTHHDNAAEGGNTNAPVGAPPTDASAATEGGTTPAPATPTGTAPPAMTGPRWRDPIVVVGEDWLRRFVPQQAEPVVEGVTPGTRGGDEADARLYVARLSVNRGDATIRVVRLVHPDLRLVALTTTRVIGMASDGEAVAAIVGVTEAPGFLHDDGGSPAAVAQLAVRLGIASGETWPAEPGERVRLLVAALQAAGAHPDAPARAARLAAWSLALHADPDLPVPSSPEELAIYGRLAGVGADAVGVEPQTGEGWQARLSPAELVALPRGEEAIQRLFREAAEALASRIAAEAPSSASASEGETA